jgi:hypothetical protein
MEKLIAILSLVLFANQVSADNNTIKFKLWNNNYEITLPDHLCQVTSGQFYESFMANMKKGVRTQPLAVAQPCEATGRFYEYASISYFVDKAKYDQLWFNNDMLKFLGNEDAVTQNNKKIEKLFEKEIKGKPEVYSISSEHVTIVQEAGQEVIFITSLVRGKASVGANLYFNNGKFNAEQMAAKADLFIDAVKEIRFY